jgi:hypothetical protein
VRVDDARASEVETLLNGTGRVDLAERGREYRTTGWDGIDAGQPTLPVGVAPLGSGLAPTTTTEALERDRLGSSMHA